MNIGVLKLRPLEDGVFCIKKTTRYTSGSVKPMAMSKKTCYDDSAVRQLLKVHNRDSLLWELMTLQIIADSITKKQTKSTVAGNV